MNRKIKNQLQLNSVKKQMWDKILNLHLQWKIDRKKFEQITENIMWTIPWINDDKVWPIRKWFEQAKKIFWL